MKKFEEKVNNIILNANSPEWAFKKLDAICERRCDCNCKGCYVTYGKQKVAEMFGVEIPKDPTPAITVNITVEPKGKAVFKFKNTEFRWI